MRDSRAEAALLHIIDTSRLLEVLRDDDRAIVRAASQASKAADFLLGFLPGDEARASAANESEAACDALPLLR
jgi:antirestriction protein ArdC